MLVLSLVVALAPQAQKINAPLPRDTGQDGEAGQDAVQLRLSSGGLWAVYVADEGVDGTLELFSVPTDGSAASRKISGGEVFPPGSVNPLELDPGGTTAVYVALSSGSDTLFRAPIDGSGPSQPLGSDIRSLEIAPDGQHVVFTARQPGGGTELFSVPLDGSVPAVRLSGGGAVGDHHVTPDGSTVVYRGDEETAGKLELWRVPVTGGVPPERVSMPLGSNRDVAISFAVTDDGSRVLYRADQNLDEVFELCSVPVDPGSGLGSFCTAVPSFADVASLLLSPDGTRVLFLADARFDERYELFQAPVNGSTNPRLVSGTMIPAGDVLDVGFSPDGAFALFLADKNVDGQVELFSTPLDPPGPPVRLSPDLIPAGEVDIGYRVVDGWLLFRADAEQDGQYALYRVPVSGGTPVRLHGALDPGQSVEHDLLPGPGGVVVFRGDLDREGVTDLWSVPADGSAAPTRLTSTLGLSGDVQDLGIPGSGVTADSVVFLADIDPDETFQVWRAPLDGSQAPVALNGILAASPIVGDVTGVAWSPDGRTALYVADQSTDGLFDLLAVDLEDGVGPVRLSSPSVGNASSDGDALVHFLEPDDQRVLYRGNFPAIGYAAGSDALLTAPLDGSEAAIRIDAPATGNKGGFVVTSERAVFVEFFSGFHPPPFMHVWSAPLDGSQPAVEISPGGSEVAFSPVVTPDGNFVWLTSNSELYRVPIDGSLPAEPLGLGTSGALQVAPQGDRIVFKANPDGMGPGLYVLPVDGSGVPLRLDELPDATRTIDATFTFTPGGERVLYVADQDAPGVEELYSVPIAGGATVKLSATPVSGGDVAGGPFSPPFLLVSLDGSRVLYVADQDVDEAYELYSAPVDGSAPPVKLNDPLSDARDVVAESTRLTPDGRLVLWAADQEVDGRLELYLAPIDGSQPAVKLNPPLVAGGSLGTTYAGTANALRLGPRGLRAYYLADQEVDGRFELFAVSLYGLGVQKVNDPLVAGGGVNSFQLSPSGHQVLYVADQEVDEVREAFLVTFPDVTPVAPHPAPTRSVTATLK